MDRVSTQIPTVSAEPTSLGLSLLYTRGSSFISVLIKVRISMRPLAVTLNLACLVPSLPKVMVKGSV